MDELSSKYEAGEQVVEEILSTTLWGSIVDELFLSGNMPAVQAYLIRHSFMGEFPQKDTGSAITEKLHYAVVSVLLLVNILLRGISQVYLCNNPLSGILICIGLYLTDPKLLIYALVGCASATFGAFAVCLPASTEILSGLTGYDGSLVGCAIATFITPMHSESSDYGVFWGSLGSKGMAITAVLSVLSGVLHMSCRHMASLPALTLSFNICLLAFLLMLTDGRSDLTRLGWESSDDDTVAVDSANEYWIAENIRFFHDATARGVGQFMFVGNTVGAWMVILGIAITSRRAAVAATTGSFTASVACRYILVVPDVSLVAVHNGIYGYSAAGVCTAIGGGVFYHATLPALILGIMGAIFAVYVQLAVEAILINDNLALPSLTIPFVATTWFIMMSRSAWLDPKTDGDEDMDDVLFQNKKRKRKPLVDDPHEKWNTRDKSQLDRRETVRTALSRPFAPFHKMLSESSILQGNKISIPENDSRIIPPLPQNKYADVKNTVDDVVVKENDEEKESNTHLPFSKNKADLRKIAITDIEDF